MMSTGARILPVLVVAAALLAAAPAPLRAQDQTGLVFQVQELIEEVRMLRGLVEDQQREIENLRRRQRDQYLDLDQRLQRLSGGEPAVASAPMVSPAPGREPEWDDEPELPVREAPPVVAQWPADDGPELSAPIDTRPEVATLPAPIGAGPRDLGTPSAEEQAAYDRAFRALRETRYQDSARLFREFLERYPDSSYAPNALYWLAETYYVTREFGNALTHFQALLNRYPGSNKEGDALLKIGFSHFELRQWNEARAALEQVRAQFPNTTLARLAEGRLRDMRLAGHF